MCKNLETEEKNLETACTQMYIVLACYGMRDPNPPPTPQSALARLEWARWVFCYTPQRPQETPLWGLIGV